MVVNIKNNKKYIGQSIDIKTRFEKHHLCEYNNKNNSCYNSKFYQALRKYGLNNFKVEILETCEEDKLNEREKFWIRFYDSYKNGYNSTIGGKSLSENLFSENTKNKRKETLEKNQSLKSENHPRSKLTNKEVEDIRLRYISGEEILSIYGDYKHVYDNLETFKRIIFGKTYKNVGFIPSKEQIRYTNKNKKLGKIPEETIKNIRADREEGLSYPTLSKKYNLSTTMIKDIVDRKFYKYIN